MSQPALPEKPDLTREDALNIILTSIGMEELGLSHVINAEGEKLQYILGTSDSGAVLSEPATVGELLDVNKSIRETLNQATMYQMLLNDKMETAMNASDEQDSEGIVGPAGPQGPAGQQGPAGPQGAQGPTGEQGLKGDTGPSGPAGPTGPTGSTGSEGPRGPEGIQGIQGIAGTVGTIKGSFISEDALREAYPDGGEPGDFFYINPNLWVWDEENGDWLNIGEIAGPQGLPGIQGARGDAGPAGPAGPTGPTGPTGLTEPVILGKQAAYKNAV